MSQSFLYIAFISNSYTCSLIHRNQPDKHAGSTHFMRGCSHTMFCGPKVALIPKIKKPKFDELYSDTTVRHLEPKIWLIPKVSLL